MTFRTRATIEVWIRELLVIPADSMVRVKRIGGKVWRVRCGSQSFNVSKAILRIMQHGE